MPEPSGSRTSMTTMSGWNRRACSIDSAALPASATTWNPSRRSRSATRPCRTTSWSSTTSRRRGREVRSVTVIDLRWRQWDARKSRRWSGRYSHDDTRAGPIRALDRRTCRPCPTARSRMLPRPWWRPKASGPGTGRDRSPRPLSSMHSTRSSSSSRRGSSAVRVAPEWRATLRQRLAGDEQQVRAAVRAAARACGPAPPSRSTSRSITACIPISSPSRARASTGSSGPPIAGPQPEDVRADVGDDEVQGVDRAVDAGDGVLPAVLVLDELGDVLERQAHGVDRLDDPVVEVLADPLALLDDRRAAGPGRGAGRSRWRCRRGPRTSRPGARRPP